MSTIYVSSTANKIKPKIKPCLISHFCINNFLIFLKMILIPLLSPTDKPEIENVISPLDSNNLLVPNSILTTVFWFLPFTICFRQKYSTTHALISLTKSIRKMLDDRNIGCEIFVDLHKTFDTIENDILLSRLEHYGVYGLGNEWIKSYQSNRKQSVSINGYDSDFADMKFGVPLLVHCFF